MQILLTQEEYNNLVEKDELEKANKALDWARETISGRTADGCRRAYCDMCPIADLGGNDIEIRPSREISKTLCTLPRNYHK